MKVLGIRAFGSATLRAACAVVWFSVAVMTAPTAANASARERLDAIGSRLRSANFDKCSDTAAHCGGRFILSDDNRLNAWSDGRNVSVTGKMIRFAAEDDALAFVIAHEMAHNLLEHAERLKGVSSHFVDARTAARVKATEIEADVLAIELVRKAGFDPAAAERLLRRMAMRPQTQMPATYPSMTQRIALVRRATGALAKPTPASRAP